MKMYKLLKLADFVTMGNLVAGLISVIYSIKQNFTIAVIFMVLAVIFDALDGRVARLSKNTKIKKDFGKELDSLADVVSFGAAPAIFGYCLGLREWYFVVILLFFAVCGMLRLSRFNILNIKGYIGVPITVNGLLFPVL